MAEDYLATADVWTVLDLIVAEFQSDPMSVQCFDLRIVRRAIELNRAHRRQADAEPDLLAACKEALQWHGLDGDHISEPVRGVLIAAIAKAEGPS